MDLLECREKIDAIDEQLLKLFIERMDVAKEVALYKHAHNLPIYHPTREQEMLEKIEKAAKNYGVFAQTLYQTILKISKDYQEGIINELKEESPCNMV